MTTPSAFPSDLSGELGDLLARQASPKELSQYLFRLTLEQTRAADPALAEMLRVCAIPRRFDADIIGVLREAPDDRETNERLLAGLLPFNFVLARKDGGYVYHDNTRDMLLEDWHAEQNREQFDRFNQRLVAFYEAEHKKSQQMEQDLERVAPVVQRANPARYVQLASLVETRVIAPLLEALYHETLRSAAEGYSFFSRYCEAYEASGRLTVCLSLVNAARNYLEWLPPNSGQEPLLKWLKYWEARLEQGLRRREEAEKLLRELLPATGDDAKLKLWTLGELGGVLHQQYKLRDAREFYQQELAQAEETRVDPYNLPVSYSRVASLHWTLDELNQAVSKYREVLHAARKENNPRMEAYGRLDLSGALQDRGEWTEAFDVALEALHHVRTRFPQDYALQQIVAGRFMFLLARHDPRLLDTLFVEAQSLTGADNPLLALESRNQYADLLRQSGQLRRAEECVTALRQDAAEYADTALGTAILFCEALLREEQGRIAEALEHYNELLRRAQEGRGTAWHEAAAYSNRALLNSQRAHYQEVEPNLQQATARWEAMGHEKLSAYMQVYRARALRRQGRMSEAQQWLDEVRDAFADGDLSHLADIREVQGDVFRDQARWAEAREHYQQSLTLHRALNQIKRAAQNLSDLATVAAEQGEWEDAARCSAEAHELWQRLADVNRYQPSDASQQADDENARGLRHFSTGGDERRNHLLQARELFRSASERVPDHFWYHLNLAYTCAELEEWAEAAHVLEAAVERAPEWLRSPVLHERLSEYRLKQGERLFRDGNPQAAAEAFAQSQERLEQAEADGRVPLNRLAEGWLKLGDGFFNLGQPAEAQAKYEAGLTRAVSDEDASVQATLHARLGFVAACRAEWQSAVQHFRQSLALWAQAGVTDPAWSLMNDCSGLVNSLPTYRVLNDSLRALTDHPMLDPVQRRRLRGARFEFIRNKYLRTRRSPAGTALPDSLTMLPVVTPIALEADASLFPDVPNSPQDWMVNVEAPALRTRIQESLGVRVPGIRLRANEDFSTGYYLLMLHEIPMVSGFVYAGEKYCPDADACTALRLTGTTPTNFDGETRGMWLAEEDWEPVEKAGLPLWDAYQYMMFHLESLIRRHLATFLGVQEVQNILEEQEGDHRTLRQRELPDAAARLRLVQVLQGLVREGVPIKDFAAILSAFAEANPECPDVMDIVETVRLTLRSDLPGNEGTRQLMGLSPDFEKAMARWIWEQDGKRFFAIPPETTQNLLSAVRTHLAGQVVKNNLALVVRNPRLRPFVRRLVEWEFPSVPVLSESELREGSPPLSEQVTYVSDLDEGAEA